MASWKFISICLVIGNFSGASASPETSSKIDCGDGFKVLVNRNALIPAEEYSNANARMLHTYKEMFPPEFGRNMEQKRSRWLDVAGGFGNACLKAALSPSEALVTVINAQDFWKLVHEDPGLNGDYFRRFAEKPFLGMAADLGISLDGIVRVENDRPIFYPDWQETLRGRLKKFHSEAVADGKFDYRVGFAEEVLPKLGKKFDVLSDLFGAYYYSGDRLDLLQKYYASLDNDGSGYIVFHSIDRRLDTSKEKWEWVPDAHGPENEVILAGGTRLSLEEYLVEKYPSIFSIVRAGHRQIETKVLVMKRDPAIAELDLSKHLTPEQIGFPESPKPSMKNIPRGEWRAK